MSSLTRCSLIVVKTMQPIIFFLFWFIEIIRSPSIRLAEWQTKIFASTKWSTQKKKTDCIQLFREKSYFHWSSYMCYMLFFFLLSFPLSEIGLYHFFFNPKIYKQFSSKVHFDFSVASFCIYCFEKLSFFLFPNKKSLRLLLDMPQLNYIKKYWLQNIDEEKNKFTQKWFGNM